MNLKNPDLDLIQSIHPECGFYGFMICFWIRNSGFRFSPKNAPNVATMLQRNVKNRCCESSLVTSPLATTTRQQRERKHNNRVYWAKPKRLHVHHAFVFICYCRTTTWKCLILRFVEDVKVMLHGTISNDDFKRNTALQCWNSVVTIWNNVATTLQRCVVAKNRRCKIFRVASP